MDDSTRRRLRFLINLFFISAVGLLIYLFFRYAFPFALPFLIGFFVSLCVEPAVRFLSERRILNRKAGGFLFPAAVWGILSVLLFRLGGVLYHQAIALLHYVQQGSGDFFQSIRLFLESAFSGVSEELSSAVLNYFDNLGVTVLNTVVDLLGGLSGIVMSIPSMIVSLFVAVVSSVFISMDLPHLKGVFLSLLPARHIVNFFEMKGFVIEKTLKILRADIIIMAITSVELFIGFSFLHIEYGLLFSVMIALLDALPVIGTGTFLIPWGLFEILVGNTSLGIGLLVLLGVISVVREMITPRLIGRQIGLNPLWTLAGMYVGMNLFGFAGIFIAPVLLMFVKNLYDSGKISLWHREKNRNPANL